MGSSTVRVDAGVAAGQRVTTHYDALLAKVVAHAPTRAEAAAVLATALRSSRIHGLRTNRDLLAAVLTEPEFLAGGTDTGYLDRHPPGQLVTTPVGRWDDAAAAAVLALRTHRARHAVVQAGVTPGWRNVVSADPLVRLATDDSAGLAVRYRVAGDQVEVWVDDRPLSGLVQVVPLGPQRYEVVLERDGLRSSSVVEVHLPHLDVSAPAGSVDLVLVDPLPAPATRQAAGSLTAPMPGLVTRTEVHPGDPVRLGQPLLVLEAMKMEHTVRAPADGRLAELLVQVGDQVDVGQPLAVLAPAPPADGAP